MKKIIVLLILLSSLSYSQLSMTKGLYTKHITDELKFNNDNQQIGIEYNNFYLQYMLNSIGDDTVSLTYNVYIKNFYVGVGFARGYDEYYEGVRNGEKGDYKYKPYVGNGYSLMAYVGYEMLIVENVSICVSYAPDCVNMLLKVKLID